MQVPDSAQGLSDQSNPETLAQTIDGSQTAPLAPVAQAGKGASEDEETDSPGESPEQEDAAEVLIAHRSNKRRVVSLSQVLDHWNEAAALEHFYKV